jgi:hypothetical protein
MKRQTLLETNPYLKDPAEMRKLISRSVTTSCAVEGIRVEANAPTIQISRRKKLKRIFKSGLLSK